jgi:3-hydroxyisobutyrate dehydrogenase-like beta-hydroxyacid dehydrogenase
MGSALLERLRLAHVEALVYDVDPAARDRATAAGGEAVASAAALARAATMIDVVVRTDDEVLDCTLGEGGIVEGARPGTLVLLHSTILPQTTRRAAEAAQKRDVHVIDACMLGVPDVVRRGELTFVVGGSADLFERARPHLLSMARQVRHVGSLGTGNVAKLVRNLTTGAETLVVHEAIRLAEAGGLPYVQALELLADTQGASMLSRWQRTFDPSGADPTPSVGHNIMAKDIPLAAELARLSDLDLPIIEQLSAAGLRLSGTAQAS